MEPGYCFELEADAGGDWRAAHNDSWETTVYTPVGTEAEVGTRRIDGAACVVFRCADGTFRAQTEVTVAGRRRSGTPGDAGRLAWTRQEPGVYVAGDSAGNRYEVRRMQRGSGRHRVSWSLFVAGKLVSMGHSLAGGQSEAQRIASGRLVACELGTNTVLVDRRPQQGVPS